MITLIDTTRVRDHENEDYLMADLYMELEELRGDYIAIMDLQFWNGKTKGYKRYRNLSELLVTDSDFIKLYVSHGQLRLELVHHDGTHRGVIREYKEHIEYEQQEHFEELIYNNEVTPHQIAYYTKSIGKDVLEATGRVGTF